jgi:small-conductance mechanosensitive channel
MAKLSTRQQEITADLTQWAEESALAESLIYQNTQDDDRHGSVINDVDQQLMAEIELNQIEAAKEAKESLALAYASNDNLTSLLTEIRSRIFALEGAFKNVGGKARIFGSQVWDLATNSFNTSLFRIGETPVTPRGILIALLIMLMGWVLSWLLRRFLSSLGDEENESHSVYYTIGRLGHYTLILLSFLLGLSLLGISLTSFAVVAGALAIGIGFGLQAIVNNFISGLILLFERSLKVGDFIEFSDSGLRGEVKAINVRSTEIKTNDNIDIIVPNSEFMNTKVVNWTLHEPYRRSLYDFRIGFEDDKYLVREAVIAAASELPYTLTGIPGKGPQVWLVGYEEFAYHMQLAVWLKPSAVKRPQVVNAAFYWAIDDALRKHNIKVPVPKREIVIMPNDDGGAAKKRSFDSTNTENAHVSPIQPPPPANTPRLERR